MDIKVGQLYKDKYNRVVKIVKKKNFVDDPKRYFYIKYIGDNRYKNVSEMYIISNFKTLPKKSIWTLLYAD